MKLQLIHHHRIPSTNTWAKEHAHELSATALTIITADEQTAGRGRYNRNWFSPAGLSLYASFCYFTPISAYSMLNTAQLLPAAACLALEDIGIKPRIKWPNDIMVQSKKLAGILTETTPAQNRLLIILGLGLNVNLSAEMLTNAGQPATSIWMETGEKHEVTKLLTGVTEKLVALMKEDEGRVAAWFRKFNA